MLPGVPVPSATSGIPTPVSDIQQEFEKLDPSDANYRSLLSKLLNHPDLKPHIQSLQEPGLEGFVELLDTALSHIQETDDLFRKTLRRLQSICSNRGVLPRSYFLPSGRLSNKGGPFASGRFSDVHKAELDGKKACVKVFRSYAQDVRGATKKRFYREVVVWKRLQHPNIVPFLGVPTNVPPPFQIVCGWMENGRITEYVRKNPEVDRVDLLWDVADGLHFLHSNKIIHGDLKGANVLIDRDCRARLTDFGLTSIIRGEDSSSALSPQDSNSTGTTTWAAPEILRGGPISKEGDVFTFAMVTVETFTGRPPFSNSYQAAIYGLLSGERPKRPESLRHEGLWQVTESCWNKEPKERPTTSQLLEFFRTSFPRERGTPKAQPIPSTSSTWTLDTEGSMDEDTKDSVKQEPLDPSTWNAQAGDHQRQNQVKPFKEGLARIQVNPLKEETARNQVILFKEEPAQTQVNPLKEESAQNHAQLAPRDKRSLFKRAMNKIRKRLKKLISRKTPQK